MSTEKEYYQKLNQMFEMTNLRPRRTGLTVCVYVSERNSSHGPRIKFMNGYGYVSVNKLCTMTVSDSPEIISDQRIVLSSKDIGEIKRWVILNKDLLISLWNGEIDEIDFAQQMNTLEKEMQELDQYKQAIVTIERILCDYKDQLDAGMCSNVADYIQEVIDGLKRNKNDR